MKQTFYFSFLLVGLFGLAFFQTKPTKVVKPLRIPGGKMEESDAKRKWQLSMLADPATGKIPENMRFKELEFVHKMGFMPVRNVNFESRGPWNVGGRTRSVVIDVMDENHMIAGGVSGGVWETKDGGDTWKRVSPVNMHPGVASICQDTRPGHTDTWYWLSGECYGTSASGGGAFYLGDGLYKSTDNGTTWTAVSSTAGGNPNQFSTFYQTGWRVAIDPSVTNQDIVYIATVGAVYRSVNGGASWQAVKGGSTSAYSYFNDVAVASDGTTYLAISSDGPAKGIWRSADHGQTFTNITPANFSTEYDRYVIGINPNNENELYFLGSTPNNGHYTFYINSDDWQSLWKYTYLNGDGSGAGGQWDDLSGNLPDTGTQFDKFSCQGGYDLVVKVQPGTNNVFIGGTSLWRSKDGFTTPNATKMIGGYKPGTEMPFFELYPNHHPDVHDLTFLPSNNEVLFTGSDGGIHRTTASNADSVIWDTVDDGYITSQFYTVGLDKHTPGDKMIWGGLQDNASFITMTDNPQDYWKMTINGDGAYGGVAHNKSAYYFSIQQGRIIKCSLDANGDLQAFKRIDPIGGRDYLFINPLVMDPHSDDLMYVAGGHRVWRNDSLSHFTLDNTWDSVSTGWTAFPDTVADIVSAISVSTQPANRVYYGTNKGKIYRIDNAHTGSPSATPIFIPGIPAAGVHTSCIAIDPTDADKVVVVYSNYNVYSMYYTTDAGATWNKVGGNLEVNVNGTGNAPSLRWLSIMPLPNGKKVYMCATSVGVYFTDSLVTHTSTTGTEWVWEGASNIGVNVCTMIECRPSDGTVVVGTHGNGAFTAQISSYTPITPKNMVQIEAKLYPNPVKDVANIELAIDKPQKMLFELYDLSGKAILRREEQASPHTALRIPLAGVLPGSYFYQIIGEDNRRTAGKLLKE